MIHPVTKSKLRLYTQVSIVGAALLGCGRKSDEHDYHNPLVPDERLPKTTEDFEEAECDDSFLADYVKQCGVVEVPSTEGAEDTISLSVVRVFTDSIRPKADPVIYLDGGPGVATLGSVQYMVEALRPMYPDRDLIFFDQRGVGLSRPELSCAGEGTVEEVLDDCYATWSQRVDLNAYRTVENAHDVARIVAALGYEQLNLLGISYGTRLALTVLREHPGIVRSAVIDSVVPLQVDLFAETAVNGQNALQTVFEACAADVDCHNKYPDPHAQLLKVVEELNDSPVDAGGFEVDGYQFIGVIFQMMYSSELIPFIPYFIDLVDSGDTDLLETLFAYTTDETGFSFGMHLSLQCAEEIAFSNRAAFEERDALVEEPLREALSAKIYLDYCEHWPVDAAPPIENEPVRSDIPTLVLAGKFDPITPPSFSMAAFDYLSAAQFFLVETESHGASVSECGAELVRSFTSDPRGMVDGFCVLDAPGFEFQGRRVHSSDNRVGGRVSWQLSAPSSAEVQSAMSKARIRRKMIRR